MNPLYVVLIAIGLIFLIMLIFFILKRMKGSIEIILEKHNFSPGEDLKGTVKLKLKKKASSDQLLVGLKCIRTDKNYNQKKPGTRENVVFNFNQPLEGMKEFAPGEYIYDFSIKIPNNVNAKINEVAEDLMQTAAILIGGSSSIEWQVYSELRCPRINLTKNVKIIIS